MKITLTIFSKGQWKVCPQDLSQNVRKNVRKVNLSQPSSISLYRICTFLVRYLYHTWCIDMSHITRLKPHPAKLIRLTIPNQIYHSHRKRHAPISFFLDLFCTCNSNNFVCKIRVGTTLSTTLMALSNTRKFRIASDKVNNSTSVLVTYISRSNLYHVVHRC